MAAIRACLWLRSRAATFFGSLDPKIDGDLGVRHCFLPRGSVGHATGQVGYFSDECTVFVAQAESEGVSINSLVTAMIAEAVGRRSSRS